jgi:hypothetical protein
LQGIVNGPLTLSFSAQRLYDDSDDKKMNLPLLENAGLLGKMWLAEEALERHLL